METGRDHESFQTSFLTYRTVAKYMTKPLGSGLTHTKGEQRHSMGSKKQLSFVFLFYKLKLLNRHCSRI